MPIPRSSEWHQSSGLFAHGAGSPFIGSHLSKNWFGPVFNSVILQIFCLGMISIRQSLLNYQLLNGKPGKITKRENQIVRPHAYPSNFNRRNQCLRNISVVLVP